MRKTVRAAKPLSDAESRRIIREDFAANLLVEAGAGSGKTQMLAERMAAGIASGVYQVEHLAAVTFTRKAASELRGRFHLALERGLQIFVAPGGFRLQPEEETASSTSRRRSEPRTLFRRHDPFVLRSPPPRAARRIRRLPRLHRVGRGSGRGAPQPIVERFHREHALRRRRGHVGVARDWRAPA